MYETARIEYDAYRTDLEFYGAARDTEINQLRLAETQLRFNEKKTEFEKLRSDVQIKLKFLDDNRVSRVCRNIYTFMGNSARILLRKKFSAIAIIHSVNE